MPNTRTYNRSFAGGEVSPELYGRIDDAKYQAGAATLRNFIATPQGPAENRPGFQYVNATKGNGVARLIPFTYSTDQTMVIEVGEHYFRFHTQGSTLLSSGVPYEIANPYDKDDLFDIHYVQSNDVLTLVHPNYPPAELKRLGATSWTYTPISFAPAIEPPEAVSAVASPGFKAKISSVSGTTITTATNHTLVMADPVYVAGIGSQSGFYMVAKIPVDGTGADILNQVQLMDYDGNMLSITGYTSGGTIQYGGKIYDINSYYVVTAVDDKGNESKISDEVSALNNLNVTGSFNTISWSSEDTKDVYQISVSATTHLATITMLSGDSDVFTVGERVSFTIPNVNLFGVGTIITSKPDTSSFTVQYSGSTTWVVTGFGGGGTVTIGKVTGYGKVEGAARYRTYKKKNGLYGFIGETTENSFVDNNIAPDMGITPPIYDDAFSSTDNYPGAVSYFEQRRIFAGTNNKPQSFWGTKSGTESNFSYALPTTDSDRIAVRIASREANTIRHIIPLTQLLMLTSSAEIRVSPVNSDALTPTTISAKPQSYVGASNVQPVIVNNALVYCAARGGHVRELGYNWQANGFITGDLSLRASHLFDNFSIVDQAFTKAPRPIVWFVSSNGELLGLTYIPEEQVGAWHWHDTDGVFESITAVAEGEEDRLYAVVRRTINGEVRRYIERMATRQFDDLKDAFFVDSGLTYSGVPADNISGLGHLEGKTVAILADGAVVAPQVVTGGSITLPEEASTVHVGLPIAYGDVKTLPVAMQIDGYGQGRQKNVNKVWVKVFRSGSVWVGPDENSLKEDKPRTTEAYGNPPRLKSEEIELTLSPSWQESGQILIRQKDPLPLTVCGITMEVAIGG